MSYTERQIFWKENCLKYKQESNGEIGLLF